jgi:hypothetical protein
VLGVWLRTPFPPLSSSHTHTALPNNMPTTRSATAAAIGGPIVPVSSKQSASSMPSPMRKPMKRSSSIASLPTPPRTMHKRRGKGRSSQANVVEIVEENEEEDVLPTVAAKAPKSKGKSARAPQNIIHGRKRQRVEFDVVEEEDDETNVTKPKEEDEAAEEESFWLDRPQSSTHDAANASPPALLDNPKRVLIRAPVSPPPSTHKHRTAPVTPKARVKATVSVVVPVTPPPRHLRSTTKAGPVRDSGNNPFLDDEDTPGSQLTMSPPNPKTPTPHVEPATLTYVLLVSLFSLSYLFSSSELLFPCSRGTRALVANPLFKTEALMEARSHLPMEHPDYEPNELCPPKRLFHKEITEIRRTQPARQAKLAPRTPSPNRAARGNGSPSRREAAVVPKTPPRRSALASPGVALDLALGPLRGGRR